MKKFEAIVIKEWNQMNLIKKGTEVIVQGFVRNNKNLVSMTLKNGDKRFFHNMNQEEAREHLKILKEVK